MLSERELLKMIYEAHEACRQEAMNCPWCSGYISSSREEHDEFCQWPAVIDACEPIENNQE